MKNKKREKERINYRRKRAQSLVEFSLAIPVLLILFMGTIETVLFFKSYLTIQQATREGARVGSMFPCDDKNTDPAPYGPGVNSSGNSTGLCGKKNFFADTTILSTILANAGPDESVNIKKVEIYNVQLGNSNTTSTEDVYTPLISNGKVTGWSPDPNNPSGNWAPKNRNGIENPAADTMGVRISFIHTSKTGFFGSLLSATILYNADTRMRMEPPQNQAPTG